jgi:hypothetical protein
MSTDPRTNPELDEAVQRLATAVSIIGTLLGRGGHAWLLTDPSQLLIRRAQQVAQLAAQAEPGTTFASSLDTPNPFLPILGDLATGSGPSSDEVDEMLASQDYKDFVEGTGQWAGTGHLDDPAGDVPVCADCGAPLRRDDHGTLIDSTGGDVCGWASGEANANTPHRVRGAE